MLEFACSEPRGLETITDLELLKEAFHRVAKGLAPDAMVEQACSSAYPTELILDHFAEVVRSPTHTERLRKFSALVVENACCFEEQPFRTFADAYRSALVHLRLRRGDYRRAWDEVKAAHRGFATHEVQPGHPPVHGSAFELAASVATLHKLISDVHHDMCQRQLVVPVRQSISCKTSSTEIYPTAPTVAGWPFAVAVAGVCEHGVKPVGRMVLAISAHLNTAKRSNQYVRQLEEEGI